MENFILNSGLLDAPVVRVPEQAPDISLFVGSNQRKLLIVSMKEPNSETTDLDFLKKIFASVKIDLERDASLLTCTQSNEFSWNDLTKSVEFEHFVFFGSNPKNVGLQFDYNWYKTFTHQQRHFLIAEPLDLIAADRSRKGALWAALKEMFLP